MFVIREKKEKEKKISINYLVRPMQLFESQNRSFLDPDESGVV